MLDDVQANQSATVDALLKAILEEEELDAAFQAVRHAGEGETAVAQLGKALQDTQETPLPARHTIINLLLQLGSPAAVEPLGAALADDPDPGVRRAALGALEMLDSQASLLRFQDALSDKDRDNQRAALVSLGIAVRESVLAYQADDERKEAISQQLGQVKIANLARLLNREVANLDQSLISKAAAEALGIIGGAEAMQVLCQFLSDELTRQNQIEAAVGLSDEERARQNEMAALRAQIAWSVVIALREIGAPEAVPCLASTLRRSVNDQVRQVAADALGRLAFPNGIEPLFEAALLDQSPKVRHAARDALARIPDWRKKVELLLRALEASPLQRGQLDAMVLVGTVRPSDVEMAGKEHQLTDFLIARALDHTNNDRLLSLCASLVIASANGSLTLAGERIDAFRKASGISEEQLRPLRVEVGGAKALSPVLSQLEENLKTYFQEPIKTLNSETQHVWRQTIRIAQIGFVLRALMSVTLFGIGAYLVLSSYTHFVSGTLDVEGFFGPGVAFVAGLGTMLTMIYTGLLREIRKSVSDVGAADAAFMAYIHRLLQVSHTFSYYYLDGKATFDELETAGDLIEDTLQETVRIIRSSSEDEQKAGQSQNGPLPDLSQLPRADVPPPHTEQPTQPTEGSTVGG